MLFCTATFALFFAAVMVVYWALPRNDLRVALLVAASVFFYASWNRALTAIICCSTVMDFLIGLGIERSRPSVRRLLLATSIAANLGLLTYFKYANFFLRSAEEALAAAGASVHLPVLHVILPIGISFYTFEAISYTVDVYRGRVRAERNVLHFLLFITFFPHLIAGPIVRARHFLPQVGRVKTWSWSRLYLGLQLFVMGMFKKMVIADRMALFADPVFASPADYGSRAEWAALVAYALQIYCDFSGYTDMALGCAHALGFKLPWNFDRPYLSRNVSEFWRRWHISLSTWLRDYVFIPLGGSQGDARTYRNLMVTMVLGGFWHGAAWTFVVWGAVHGLLLCTHRWFRGYCAGRPALTRVLASAPGTALRIAATFLSVALAWVFFRAPTLGAAGTFFRHLLPGTPGLPSPLEEDSLQALVLVAGLAHIALLARAFRRVPPVLQGLGLAVLSVLALCLAPQGGKVFIYFQF